MENTRLCTHKFVIAAQISDKILVGGDEPPDSPPQKIAPLSSEYMYS